MAFDSEPTLPAVCVCSRCTRRDEAWARADALRVRVVFLEDHVAGDACRSPVSAIVIDANDRQLAFGRGVDELDALCSALISAGLA